MSYESKTIRDAIGEVNRTYYLPAIQREFVWDTKRIEKLFDSIMADYPISSFLFWKVREENKKDWISYEFVREFDKENPHNLEANLSTVNKDVYFVLDGQQRLTSLNIGLRGSYRYFYYKWKKTFLYINLLKPAKRNDEDPEELEYHFEFRESTETKDPDNELWYPVGDILDFQDSEDAKEDLEKTIEHYDKEKQDNARRLIGRLHARIHTYKLINFYEEKSQDYDKVVEVFIRANTAGKTLEYSDILLSTATAKWENLNAREEINEFVDAINKTGNGYKFGKDFVLKGCLYLTENLPIKYKIGNFTKSNLEKIEENWETIKRSIESSVFLVSKFGFNEKNITASMALLPIAFYLSRIEKKNFIQSSEENDVKCQLDIKKWLTINFLKGTFGGSSDSTLNTIRNELKLIKNNDVFPAEKLNQKLNVSSSFTDAEIENLLLCNYKTKYSYPILTLLYPDRSWKDMVFHEDHIFPKTDFTRSKLAKRGYSEDKIKYYLKHFNTICNLQLLSDSENLEKSSCDFSSWIKKRDAEFKSRHVIPKMDDYGFDFFDAFVKYRKQEIKKIFDLI